MPRKEQDASTLRRRTRAGYVERYLDIAKYGGCRMRYQKYDDVDTVAEIVYGWEDNIVGINEKKALEIIDFLTEALDLGST